MKNLALTLSATALLFFSSSCNHNDGWALKGDIEGAAGKTILLEGSANGRWYFIDSVSVANNGTFKFEQPAAMFPGIYRITIDGQSAYFPIDSAETVKLTGNLDNLGATYSLSGSTGAENMNKANALISSAGSSITTNAEAKRELSQLILEDPAGITAYYIVSSVLPTGQPVYDPSDRTDLRIIGAVANAYSEQRPNDPRTGYLKNLFLSHRTAATSGVDQVTTLEVPEVGYPEIELLDEHGKKVKLSDVVTNGPTLVSFTSYTADFSPLLNVELAKLQERHGNLQIYQISLDADEYDWRTSAKNLPWITVYNSPKDGDSYLRRYNVGVLPTTFIINANGELVDRITGIDNLAAVVGKKL